MNDSSSTSSDVAADERNDELPADGKPWLFRWTLLILCLVWPLVWVGALVTTSDAGMSVPDWPNTYGDNLLLYPISTWLSGPFDLFIEHGHRLLGMLVGMVAIAVVVVAFVSERRRWVQALAVLGLLLVIVQGVLGGMRVVLGDRVLAMVHGCTAPIVFAVFTVLLVASSRWWKTVIARSYARQSVGAGGEKGKGDETDESDESDGGPPSGDGSYEGDGVDGGSGVDGEGGSDGQSGSDGAVKTIRTATKGWWVLALLAYFQLVLGAQLRHVSMAATPQQFTHTVATHILLAFVIWVVCAILWLRIRKCGEMTLSRSGLLLLGLVSIQILLGLATWVVNYGFPMFQSYGYPAHYLVHAKSFWGSFVVCGHVATGSLILATAVLLGTGSWRVRYRQRFQQANACA
ncbi:COX15/CtaA family protein [Roseimaritima ulvae]|uniref:Heme A synthase n=1 Tax=Roseimaritima ulvae TaxID=980254 RepID=A0A5B9QYV1_9BACT|nr:COX15/CtaA family protein [Roseimaritima ulvae]QEG43232.1 Heme A synthase [Roseimaritima ulvae]